MNNTLPPPPGKFTRSEHRLILMAMMSASELTNLPITKEKIQSVREKLDKMDRLFDQAVGECNRKEWAVFVGESD